MCGGRSFGRRAGAARRTQHDGQWAAKGQQFGPLSKSRAPAAHSFDSPSQALLSKLPLGRCCHGRTTATLSSHIQPPSMALPLPANTPAANTSRAPDSERPELDHELSPRTGLQRASFRPPGPAGVRPWEMYNSPGFARMAATSGALLAAFQWVQLATAVGQCALARDKVIRERKIEAN